MQLNNVNISHAGIKQSGGFSKLSTVYDTRNNPFICPVSVDYFPHHYLLVFLQQRKRGIIGSLGLFSNGQIFPRSTAVAATSGELSRRIMFRSENVNREVPDCHSPLPPVTSRRSINIWLRSER
jgi:hypothetical protein